MAKGSETEEQKTGAQAFDLFGEFRFKVDSKGRVAVPSEFRKVLSGDLVVSRELTDKCLYVFRPDTFNEWVEGLFEDKFGGFKSSDRRQVKMRTMLKARAKREEVDSSGRVMLNQQARDAVGITKDVVLVGNVGYFEVWDAAAFDEEFGDIDLGFFYDEEPES